MASGGLESGAAYANGVHAKETINRLMIATKRINPVNKLIRIPYKFFYCEFLIALGLFVFIGF